MFKLTYVPSVQMYNFTSFAMTLNELEPDMERQLPPTDCRLRPDIRAMENGDIGNTSLTETFREKLKLLPPLMTL